MKSFFWFLIYALIGACWAGVCCVWRRDFLRHIDPRLPEEFPPDFVLFFVYSLVFPWIVLRGKHIRLVALFCGALLGFGASVYLHLTPDGDLSLTKLLGPAETSEIYTIASSASFIFSFGLTMAVALARRRERVDLSSESFSFAWISGLGVGCATIGIYFSISALLRTESVSVWLKESFVSGAVSFWITSLLFGTWIALSGMRTMPREALFQYFLFGLALVIMGVAFAWQQQSSLVLVTLSWSTFFIIDDWILMEHFAIRGKETLKPSHLFRILLFDTIICISAVWVMVEMLHPSTTLHWPTALLLGGIALLFLIVFLGAVMQIMRAYFSKPSPPTPQSALPAPPRRP